MRTVSFYIQDIISAMQSIRNFVKDMDFYGFKEDDKTCSAVVRKFEIIGEATKAIPEEIKQKHPEIPWKEMAGMRDRLIHSYFGVDLNLVWVAITERIPQVLPQLEKMKKL
jgi:uncharacterized protein with HEPN domain